MWDAGAADEGLHLVGLVQSKAVQPKQAVICSET